MSRVPREWPDATAAILGGGPSLSPDDVAYCVTRRFRRIACNDAYTLDTAADVLVAGDPRWWAWNAQDVAATFRGKYIFSWKAVPPTTGLNVHLLKNKCGIVSHDPHAVCTNNTGGGAINIAYLFGAPRILLLGFDMRQVDDRHNWHTRHQAGTRPQVYTGEPPVKHDGFIPRLTLAAPIYAKHGVEIINCTRDSALTCFPYQDIHTIS